MSELHISLLGGLAAVGSAGSLSTTRRQPLALLALLALEPQPIARDSLAFYLWADVPQATARQRLRRTLSALRQGLDAIGAAATVQTVGDTLLLDPHQTSVDAQRFRQHAQTALRAHPSTALLPAQQALAAYGGPLLAGFALDDAPEFEHWLTVARDQHDHLYQQTLAMLVTAALTSGQLTQALTTAEQLVQADPLNEAAHRTVMRLYAATGQHHRAVQHYEELHAQFERDLGTTPLPATHRLYTADTGSGIANFGRVNLANTIVANNPGSSDVVNRSSGMLFYDDGELFIRAETIINTPLGGGGTVSGEESIIDDNPELGPLQNNGGPTLTHLPRDGSPAIDAGDNAALPSELSTDQRGYAPRIVGSRVDLGAVEVGAGVTQSTRVYLPFVGR